MKLKIKTPLLMAALATAGQASAQLSSNPDKFLGNITTDWPGSMDYDGFTYSDYWNQVTPENATKWQTVEGNAHGQYNWAGADIAYNYAKEHDLLFKFHTLVWGSQYPTWMDNLSEEKQLEAVTQWMDETQKHYPDLKVIDVVNEAIAGHAPAPYKNALGGDGATGYDWIIKAFKMARERWPEAILIYNDYNTFQWNTDQFINLVRILRDAGAPIDAYGCQSHDLGGVDGDKFATAMKKIQDALKMPMYITEYDIGDTSDANQKWNYMQHFPVMWEADYCAGVTIWGWFYGHTWINDDNSGEKGTSGIIKNKQERSALKWLREYMQTDAAKQAKSPFPGMKCEAYVYVKSSALKVAKGEKVDVDINAKLRTKTIASIDLYVDGELNTTFTTEPYKTEITAPEGGRCELKAVVKATDGTEYVRYGGFDVVRAREPYNGITELPGTLEVEDFDSGEEGVSYHDSDATDEGDAKYRTDNGGVDLVKGNGGVVLGYTAQGEWVEYTVDVKESGEYNYEAIASSGIDGAAFHVSLVENGKQTQLFKVNVGKTADNDWSVYKSFTGTLSKQLEAGTYILRITIDSPYCNIDQIKFTCTNSSGIEGVVIGSKSDQPAYDLGGRRVSDTHKGLIIKDGRKLIK